MENKLFELAKVVIKPSGLENISKNKKSTNLSRAIETTSRRGSIAFAAAVGFGLIGAAAYLLDKKEEPHLSGSSLRYRFKKR